MPDLIINSKLTVDGTVFSLKSGDLAETTAGTHRQQVVQNIGTGAEEVFSLTPNIIKSGTGNGPGWVRIHVQGDFSTDYVRVGFATGVYVLQVEQGGVVTLKVDEDVEELFLIAVGNALDVEITVIER